jgi:uncharacterized protein (TIGR02099 family)
MSEIIRRLLKSLAYGCAAVVILLALLLGLFRLFLPRLPEHQEELKAWASQAIGLQVEFAGMDARWGLRGPELTFYEAELLRPASGVRVIAADEVGVIVSLPELLFEQHLVVDTIRVRDSKVELRERSAGDWLFQGVPLADLRPQEQRAIDSFTVVGQDIRLDILRADDAQPTRIDVPRIRMQRDLLRTAFDLEAVLPPELGSALSASGTQDTRGGVRDAPWNISVRAKALQLAGLSALYRDPERRLSTGHGDLDLSFSLSGTLGHLSAAATLTDVSLNDGPRFNLGGRLAYVRNPQGWLLTADELRFESRKGAWPLSSARIEAKSATDGAIDSVALTAAHVDFRDADVVAPWLAERERSMLERWQPDGVVHNIVMTMTELGEEKPEYALSAELDRAGFAAVDGWPGMRGFTGTLRADRNGGLLAIESYGVTLDLAGWVPEPVEFDRANGTVVWRRSGTRTTILSDNITLTNALLDSRNNIEISIDGDRAPVVDLASNWRITDVAVAKRFIPRRVMSAQLYRWFQDALLAGRIPEGTAYLHGPLDAFPFDGGEGRLLVKGRVSDLEFKYHPRFPVVSVASMDVVLDNTHLYTRENRSVTLGNITDDADVDIADLRQPVLTIESLSSGTLESLHAFASASPIAQAFGGHLDRVSVSGPATLALDLTVPILTWRDFAFSARIASDAGSLAVAGFDAPFTQVSGVVTAERDHIESEALAGRLLGAPVSIELVDAGPADPGYRALALVRGAASASALVGELGLPLAGRLEGAAGFTAQVRFPRAEHEPRQPFMVRVESDLAGLALDLPAPFGKSAASTETLAGAVVFDPDGKQIESRGSLGRDLAWNLVFSPLEGGWDFDRGMLTLGGVQAAEPDVRGLHVRGAVESLRVEDWLAASRAAGPGSGAGTPMRSVDLQVGTLHVAGQRLEDHRLQVDRSARDWLVQLEGEEVSGSVFVPYDFSPSSTLVLDMERLVLPGDGDATEPAADAKPTALDPRLLPAISVRAREFGLGARRFGSVEADFVHNGDALVADPIVATDDSFRVQGQARWSADPRDPLGSHSRLEVTLTSSDVGTTMRRLGYQPGIEGEQMRIDLDMEWSGGPNGRFLESLDGEVEVTLANGQLNEVEPGAGRMFGLLSIAALPRRLSLDFSDVFQKGFGFDEISGTFRLENGSAYTCDLSLVGPAADIGVTGQADLVAGNYSQAAVVNANLGNTLPVVGAIAAGPQVAAALFLFSQIFKKPLKEVGQIYYSMNGSWDSPVVESTDAAAFAASAARAGCLATATSD